MARIRYINNGWWWLSVACCADPRPIRPRQDLHPHDRGPRGTHHGAIIANGNLYCPATPKTLLQLGPLAPAATAEQTTAHDTQAAELAKHKLGPISADDADGYHRVMVVGAIGFEPMTPRL